MRQQCASNVPNMVEDADGNRNCKGMVTIKEFAASSVHSMLRQLQRICNEGGKTVPSSIIKVIKLACGGIEARCKNEKSSQRSTNVPPNLTKAFPAECTMRGKLEAAEGQGTTLKRQLADAGRGSEIWRIKQLRWKKIFVLV